jgi:hypothetical protein
MSEWDALEAVIRRHVADALGSIGRPRWGTVTSVDPARMAVRMLMHPDDVESGWIPVLQRGAGPTAADAIIPQIGWTGYTVPDLLDASHPVVMGFIHTDAAPLPTIPATAGTTPGTPNATPVTAQAGERVLIGGGGISMRFGANGVLYINAPGGIQTDGGRVVHNSDVVANGDIYDKAGAHNTLATLRSDYDAHKHYVENVQPGSNTVLSDLPTVLDP